LDIGPEGPDVQLARAEEVLCNLVAGDALTASHPSVFIIDQIPDKV